MKGISLFQWVVGAIFRLVGWQVVGELPDVSKFVFIAAPHTSSWDFPIMLGVSYVLGARINWFGKDDLFRPPFGWIFRMLGGIPINRRVRVPTGMVKKAVIEFQTRERFILAVSSRGDSKKDKCLEKRLLSHCI